jgi:hypothetical protein
VALLQRLTGSTVLVAADSLYVRVACSQLDESLKLLPAVREMETQQADGRWAALPQQERAERGRQAGALQVSLCLHVYFQTHGTFPCAYHSHSPVPSSPRQSYLTLAMVHIRIMRFTSAEARPMTCLPLACRASALADAQHARVRRRRARRRSCCRR